MQLPGATQIYHPSERYHAAHGIVMGRESERQLSTGRVSEDENPFGVDRILPGKLAQELIAGGNVFKAARPASAGIAYAPVFEVPGSETGLGERRAEKARVLEIVASAPEAAVNKHRCREWSRPFRQTQIAKLEFV